MEFQCQFLVSQSVNYTKWMCRPRNSLWSRTGPVKDSTSKGRTNIRKTALKIRPPENNLFDSRTAHETFGLVTLL